MSGYVNLSEKHCRAILAAVYKAKHPKGDKESFERAWRSVRDQLRRHEDPAALFSVMVVTQLSPQGMQVLDDAVEAAKNPADRRPPAK